MFSPVIVYPLVYVLELNDGCYYVGITSNLNYRYSQHLSGQGAVWTRLHAPISILEVCMGDAETEDRKTIELMKKHGFKNVRGGRYCRAELNNDPTLKNT